MCVWVVPDCALNVILMCLGISTLTLSCKTFMCTHTAVAVTMYVHVYVHYTNMYICGLLCKPGPLYWLHTSRFVPAVRESVTFICTRTCYCVIPFVSGVVVTQPTWTSQLKTRRHVAIQYCSWRYVCLIAHSYLGLMIHGCVTRHRLSKYKYFCVVRFRLASEASLLS